MARNTVWGTQGSILGPLHFNTYMYTCLTFYAVEPMEIAKYTGNTTPYAHLEDFDLIIEKLEVKAN